MFFSGIFGENVLKPGLSLVCMNDAMCLTKTTTTSSSPHRLSSLLRLAKTGYPDKQRSQKNRGRTQTYSRSGKNRHSRSGKKDPTQHTLSLGRRYSSSFLLVCERTPYYAAGKLAGRLYGFIFELRVTGQAATRTTRNHASTEDDLQDRPKLRHAVFSYGIPNNSKNGLLSLTSPVLSNP